MFVDWSLFFVFVFMSLDSTWSYQEPFLTCLLSDWSLNFINIMVLLRYIIVYCITKLHYLILSYYITIIYLLLFLLFSFYFHFWSPLSFTFTFEVHLILCCLCCFISYLCHCIYCHFLLFILRKPLSQNVGDKDQQFHLVFL